MSNALDPGPPSRLRAAVRSRVVSDPATPPARAARWMAATAGPSLLGVVFFGSRKTQAGPDPWSAHDFFVLTRDYRSFYGALHAAGGQRRSPTLVAALNAVLPPNQISLLPLIDGEVGLRAKCAVIALDRFVRETGPRRRDHFCAGRLFQPAEVVFAANEDMHERILDGLVSAHLATFGWVRPWLPDRFDVETYCRTLLRVSLSREIRPEPTGRRADSLWNAQRDYLTAVYAAFLEDLAESEHIDPHGDGSYSLREAVGPGERFRVALYFRWLMLRATVRWLKYMITFEDWLDYILRKAERHTGERIVLTTRERRLPLIFLWPRVFRYLRQKKN